LNSLVTSGAANTAGGGENMGSEKLFCYTMEIARCYTETVRWIRENERENSFEMLPCQSGEVRKRFPLIEPAACMRAMQLILPDGKILSGEKALPEILKRLKRYSPAAALFSLPGSEAVSVLLPLVCRQQIPHRRGLVPGQKKETGSGKMKCAFPAAYLPEDNLRNADA
jgi:hypothetical protein